MPVERICVNCGETFTTSKRSVTCGEKGSECWKEYLKAKKRASHHRHKNSINQKKREYYQKNKEEIKARTTRYYYDNFEKISQQKKDNKEYDNAQRRERYKKDPKKYLNKSKEWRENNTIKFKEIKKQEYQRNKKKLNEQHRIYRNKKYSTDSLWRIREIIRSRIKKVTDLNNISKSKTCLHYIGLYNEDLIEYLLNLKNISTDEFMKGDYHVDHIFPLSLCNNEEELYQFNNYTNLQLLESEINLVKGKKLLIRLVEDNLWTNEKMFRYSQLVKYYL